MSSDRNPMSRDEYKTRGMTSREEAEYYSRQDAKAAQADAEAELADAIEAELEADAVREALEAEKARTNAATEEQEQQN